MKKKKTLIDLKDTLSFDQVDSFLLNADKSKPLNGDTPPISKNGDTPRSNVLGGSKKNL